MVTTSTSDVLLTCLACINFAKDVSPSLGGHNLSWHLVYFFCPLYCSDDSCRAQSVISKLRFFKQSTRITLLAKVFPGLSESLHGISCGGYKACFQGGYGQTGSCNVDHPFTLGSGNKLLSDGCHSLQGREVGESYYCAFGPAELWHACCRSCNPSLYPVCQFFSIFCICFCAKIAAIAKRKKKLCL